MVDQTRNRRQTELADERQPLVRPAPVVVGSSRARSPLPEDWVAERADPQVGDSPKVVRAAVMTRELDLVDVFVVHSIASALDTSPQLQL
jgi:hypothetical protein